MFGRANSVVSDMSGDGRNQVSIAQFKIFLHNDD